LLVLGPVAFALVFVLGAGIIAAWTTVRFPRLASKRIPVIAVHLVIAMVLVQLVPPAIHLAGSAPLGVLASLFLVAFPVLVYSFLVALWLIVLAQNALGGRLR
jgi:hypothetical protein